MTKRRTPAEHRKFLEKQANKQNKIQPLDLNEKLVHVHGRLRKAMRTMGLPIPHLVLKEGYAPESNVKDWVKTTGVKNEGDKPISLENYTK